MGSFARPTGHARVSGHGRQGKQGDGDTGLAREIDSVSEISITQHNH